MSALDHLVLEKPPIQRDEDGVYRVAHTRVRLDTIVTAFQNGSTPEEILQKYPSLSLQDVYSVVTYYLQHSAEVEAYLEHRRKMIEQADQEIEKRWPSAGVRERLLRRRRD